MVEQAESLINTGAKNKRMHMPHELFGKFSAKSDFIHYFTYGVSFTSEFITAITDVQLQLYLPPESSINKDFLSLVLQDKKKLLKLSDVRNVEVPLYDELSVVNLWPLMK